MGGLVVLCLQATGGSGNYTWSSTNVSVATVNTRGQAITSPLVGETTVTAADAKNPAHWDDMKVGHCGNGVN